MDTVPRTEPPRFPWAWVLPAALIVTTTAVTGVRRYPGLPDRLPTHFRLDGTADGYATTGVFSAFGLVFLQVALTVGLVATAYATSRARAAPGLPGDSRMLSAKALLAVTACADLSMFFAALMVWGTPPVPAALGVAVAAPVPVGVAVVLPVLFRQRRSATADAHPALSRTDDRWRGVFYVDRDDPAILVPKRVGIGYTLNFGRPASWFILAALLVTPAVMTLAAR